MGLCSGPTFGGYDVNQKGKPLAIFRKYYTRAASKRKSGAETHLLFEGGSSFLSFLILLWKFNQVVGRITTTNLPPTL
jgi:hypothetical protein